MIIEFTRHAIEGVRNALPAGARASWYETVAAELKLEPIRNRDRTPIEFPRELAEGMDARARAMRAGRRHR